MVASSFIEVKASEIYLKCPISIRDPSRPSAKETKYFLIDKTNNNGAWISADSLRRKYAVSFLPYVFNVNDNNNSLVLSESEKHIMPHTFTIDLENGVIKETLRSGQKNRDSIAKMFNDDSLRQDTGYSSSVYGECYPAQEYDAGIQYIKSALERGFVGGKCYEKESFFGKCYSD